MEICLGKVRKHRGKRRKCWLPAFSPFPTMFSGVLFLMVSKCQDWVVIKHLILLKDKIIRPFQLQHFLDEDLEYIFERVEKVEKEEIPGYQHLFLLSTDISKSIFTGLCW